MTGTFSLSVFPAQFAHDRGPRRVYFTRLHAERAEIRLETPVPTYFHITNTSERVVALIMGTAKLSNAWDGIRRNDLG